MILKSKWFLHVLLITCFTHNIILSQDTKSSDTHNESAADNDSITNLKKKFKRLDFFDYRGTNVFEGSLGSSTLLGDVEDTSYSFYFKLGYKRAVTDHLFIGLSYNKYGLDYSDITQDLVSIDFNLEYLIFPYEDLSPFVFGGFGYNTLTDFEVNAVKIQTGFGFEYIISDGIGLKLFAEYNYNLDNDMEFLINDEENDSFLRIGIGVNMYFGGSKLKERRLEEIPTQIKTNSILQDN